MQSFLKLEASNYSPCVGHLFLRMKLYWKRRARMRVRQVRKGGITAGSHPIFIGKFSKIMDFDD